MQMRAVFGFFLAVFLLPGLASAHGPTRQKLTKTIEIDAAAADVWAIIGDFQNMSWHPAVQGSTGEGGNEIDATRVLDLGGGATISEFLYKYDAEKMSYSYRISEVDVAVLPVNNYSSTLSVKETGEGKSTVTWKGAFYRGYMLNDPPEDLNEATAIAAVTGVYEAGLANIKALAEAGS